MLRNDGDWTKGGIGSLKKRNKLKQEEQRGKSPGQ